MKVGGLGGHVPREWKVTEGREGRDRMKGKYKLRTAENTFVSFLYHELYLSNGVEVGVSFILPVWVLG